MEKIASSVAEMVVYQPNAEMKLEVRVEHETVWLTQNQMALLFDVKENTITYHIKEIYSSEELMQHSTTRKIRVVRTEGNRLVNRQLDFYNLDMIISVGYRVNSKQGVVFRQWATRILKDYMLKGYAVNQRIELLEQRVTETENKIDFFVQTSLPPVQGVLFDGQIFDAYKFANDLIRSASKRIVLIDNYVDDTVLTMLDKRKENVVSQIYTKNISEKLLLDLNKHNAQYAPIEIKKFANAHDRFLILDDVVYFLGASLKDLGKKWFAFSKMEISAETLLQNIGNNL